MDKKMLFFVFATLFFVLSSCPMSQKNKKNKKEKSEIVKRENKESLISFAALVEQKSFVEYVSSRTPSPSSIEDIEDSVEKSDFDKVCKEKSPVADVIAYDIENNTMQKISSEDYINDSLKKKTFYK